MSLPNNYNSHHGRSLRPSPTNDSHSGQSYPDQGRTTLPPLTIAFPTSDPPVHNNYLYPYQQRSTTPASSQQHYYQPAQQQQQTQAPYTYSSYPPPSEQPRHYGGQAYSSHNRVSPSFSSADPRRHPPPPLDVPREGWQGSQYYSTHADPQTQHTSNDMRSPHAVYPPTSSYTPYQSQSQSLSATTYLAGHNRGAPPPVAMAGQQYQQHQSMSMSQRTMPSSRASTQLPYARPDIGTEQVVLPPDPVATDPVIKKKRKRADARQLEVLNATYARTAFPSTEERAALAKDLDMSARSVQIWFQNKRQQARQGGRSASTSSNAVSPPVPSSTPSVRDYRGSPIPVSPMVETSGPTYTSRSPPPAMMRSGQTPSPPGGRPDYSRHWPRGGY